MLQIQSSSYACVGWGHGMPQKWVSLNVESFRVGCKRIQAWMQRHRALKAHLNATRHATRRMLRAPPNRCETAILAASDHCVCYLSDCQAISDLALLVSCRIGTAVSVRTTE